MTLGNSAIHLGRWSGSCITAILITGCPGPVPYPDLSVPALVIADSRLEHPADIVRFKGRYVATELYRNRLAVFDDLELSEVRYLDPTVIGQQFKSPHYLAVTPWDTLLISNGWGRTIVEIADLDGGGWKEFSGIGSGFRAPHGICVDESGYIYVGDSLNSRLVRFRDMGGDGWEVFEDRDNQISYVRELVCDGGSLWVSNSYEGRPGLNPGQGSNLLRITDFRSGRVEVVLQFPDTNMTAVLPLDDATVSVGLWGPCQRLVLAGPGDGSVRYLERPEIGIPYGSYLDRRRREVLIAHFGELATRPGANAGGLSVYRW